MVGIALVAFALTGGMFLDRVLTALFSALKWNDPHLFGVEDLTLTAIIGFVLGGAAAVYAWLTPRVRDAGLDIAAELKRVTWPSLAETRVSTVAVIVASVSAAVILFFFDFVASKVMTVWVPAALHWVAGA